MVPEPLDAQTCWQRYLSLMQAAKAATCGMLHATAWGEAMKWQDAHFEAVEAALAVDLALWGAMGKEIGWRPNPRAA